MRSAQMSDANYEEKIELVLKEILTTIRRSATATQEVSEDKSLKQVETALKYALKDLGVEQ